MGGVCSGVSAWGVCLGEQTGVKTLPCRNYIADGNKTRMHSSRMRTGRSLTVCQSLLPGGGVCSQGGCLLEGVSALGVSVLGGLLWGVSAPEGGGGIPTCTETDTPPVNRITNRCKNITLATTSLQPVNISAKHAALLVLGGLAIKFYQYLKKTFASTYILTSVKLLPFTEMAELPTEELSNEMLVQRGGEPVYFPYSSVTGAYRISEAGDTR